MSKIFDADLTAFCESPPSTLELIDLAVTAAKRAAHSCHNDTAREHFEFALALLRETWIAESGQQARSPAQVIADVNWAMNIFAAVAERSLPPEN
ncbi:MAG: hypothetical protein ACNA8L_13895 [Luteolibacter sp.]